MTETIAPFTVCLLTPLGSGGLAAVRLFGPGAAGVLARLFQPDHQPMSGQAGRLALGWVIDPASGERIDQAMARFLPGRLGAELTLHGGVRIVQRVLAACQTLGGRRLEIPSPVPSPRRGGEIWNTGGQAASGTKHQADSAYPRDREELWMQSLDLARADNVPHPALWADLELTLPLARTRAIADWLVGQYSAGLAEAIESIVAGRLSAAQGDALLDRLVSEADGFRRALAGLRAAIIGPTNAGKSSLFNGLAGAEAAIVSEQPGTTRDYVTRWASVGGLAVELIDTAGLRGRPSELESRASELADPVVRSADVRLIVLDGAQPADAIDQASFAALNKFARTGPVIWVINKCDQPIELQAEAIVGKFGGGAIVRVSALTGVGLPDLAVALRGAFGIADLSPGSPGLFTNRQLDLVAAGRLAAGEPRNAILLRILDA